MNGMMHHVSGGNILPEPNTFIGGVGATSVTSAADFVALSTGLAEADIKNFQIDVNNNVSFYVGINYNLASTSFVSDSNITYFLDADGYCLFVYLFSTCVNLEFAYFPNTQLNQDFSFNNTILSKVNFESWTNANNRYQISNTSQLKKLDLRSLVGIGNDTNGTINNLDYLEYLFVGNCVTGNTSQELRSYIRNTGRQPVFYKNCINAVSPKVYYNSAFGVTNRKAYVRGNFGIVDIGDEIYLNGLTYTCVTTITTDGEFTNSVSSFLNAITSDTRTGTIDEPLSTANDGAFFVIFCETIGSVGNAITTGVNGSNTGNFSWEAATMQGGYDVHIFLQEIRNFGGATLVEISSPITVNIPTALSASSITSSGFTINFTAPTANANGTELYEVWVEEKGNPANPINYFYYQDVTATGTAITGLESDKTYIVKMRTQDGQMNFSDFSSIIEVTTL